jgi:hypothetical protein
MLTDKIISETKKVVKEVCAQYPEAFNPELAKSKYPNFKPVKWDLDVTRRLVIPIIARRANEKLGQKLYGVVYRNDREDKDPRPGRLTSDVLALFDKSEHIDVLSGSGAMWEQHGPITDNDWDIEDASNHVSFETLKDDANENENEAEKPPVPKPELPKQPVVSYGEFVGKESNEVAEKFLKVRGNNPAPSDLYHNAYRRLVEGMSHDKILADIK